MRIGWQNMVSNSPIWIAWLLEAIGWENPYFMRFWFRKKQRANIKKMKTHSIELMQSFMDANDSFTEFFNRSNYKVGRNLIFWHPELMLYSLVICLLNRKVTVTRLITITSIDIIRQCHSEHSLSFMLYRCTWCGENWRRVKWLSLHCIAHIKCVHV